MQISRCISCPATIFAIALMLACVIHAQGADQVAVLDISTEQSRQIIDGFGGSIAFWGYDPDDTALRFALEDLGATIVRIPGQVSESGKPDEYRNVLRNIARINPKAGVMITFWQPRSMALPKKEQWLDSDKTGAYILKPSMREAWADEIVSRIRTFTRDWGVNVTSVGVQNEANWSVPGTQTCKWQPDALGNFTSAELAPKLEKAGIKVQLSIPDLAYIGHDASEAKNFYPACSDPAIPVFCYHMYDSYKNGDTGNNDFATLRSRQKALGNSIREKLPGKKVWMTETSGATWNSNEWHPLGWNPAMDEHDKAIAAARYMHMALVDAQCNAFLWWGLVYSEAPASITDVNQRQKFRDESLVLVSNGKQNGLNVYLERTPKYFTFKQFSRFVQPGCVRLDVPENTPALIAAFRNKDASQVVVVIINPDRKPLRIKPRISGKQSYRLIETWITDRSHQCEQGTWVDSASPESVTTLVYTSLKP